MSRLALLLIATAPAGVVGCYTGDTLVQRVRDRAISSRLEEIDLGHFRTTLPRDTQNAEVTEIDIHLFGELQRYKISGVEEQLEERAFLLHDRTLATLRQLDQRDLANPDLSKLREQVLLAVNSTLDEPLFENIGIRDLRFIRH